jgi:hypothetical protein
MTELVDAVRARTSTVAGGESLPVFTRAGSYRPNRNPTTGVAAGNDSVMPELT